MTARRCRGVTLIDLSMAVAVAGILASVAIPSYQAQLARSQRMEAITALTRVQAVQEQFRAHHGSYALQMAALQGVVPQGAHYQLTLASAHASGYIARASWNGQGPRDKGCTELSLSVTDGIASHGPSERCWNR
jgi:type IV pilus assembly protein PilE